MSRHIRPRRPGASVFFTVTLAAHGSDLLVREGGEFVAVGPGHEAGSPFHIEARMVPPDPLQRVWTRTMRRGWTRSRRGFRGRCVGGSHDLAEAVLGASCAERGRFRSTCAVLLDQPGEAWVGGAGGGLAVFVVGETRPRLFGVKTVQWTVFRVERPRTLARAGGMGAGI